MLVVATEAVQRKFLELSPLRREYGELRPSEVAPPLLCTNRLGAVGAGGGRLLWVG